MTIARNHTDSTPSKCPEAATPRAAECFGPTLQAPMMTDAMDLLWIYSINSCDFRSLHLMIRKISGQWIL